MKPAILTILLLASACLGAQNTDNLSQFFEGKQVIVKIDMPGSQQGIDIYPQKGNLMDAKSYGKRMKDFPVSIRSGDMVMVTTVKVKDKSIEFRACGRWFWNVWRRHGYQGEIYARGEERSREGPGASDQQYGRLL